MKLTNILRRWEDIEKLRRGEKVWPSMVGFHTSNQCNQHCIGCAFGATHDHSYLDEKTHFRVLDELLEGGTKAFEFCGGGEQTMLPYLAKIMNYIHDHGAHFGLFTNGLILKDDVLDVLVRAGSYVRVSLEASCREDYMAYKRVPGEHWDKVIFNLGRLLGTRLKYGSKLEISVKFAVGTMLRGKKHYQRCLTLANEFDRVTIKALRYFEHELSTMERYIEDSICRKVVADSGMEDRVNQWIAPYSDYRIPQCWLNPLQTVIDHTGQVNICCYVYWNRQDELSLGNINERSFKDIWMDDAHWEKVKRIDRKNCSRVDCKFFKWHEIVNAASTRGLVEFL